MRQSTETVLCGAFIGLVGSIAGLLVSGCEEVHINMPPVEPEPTATATVEPTLPPDPIEPETNPPCAGRTGFSNGTLWKPVAENNSNCVFLIRNDFIVPFECKAELKSGELDTLKYTGKSNGDRQTHRCNTVAREYKVKAKIFCDDGNQVCVFELPGRPRDRHE